MSSPEHQEQYETNILQQHFVHEMDMQVKQMNTFQKRYLKCLVLDYIQLKRYLKERSPFRSILHFIRGVLIPINSNTSDVDMPSLHFASREHLRQTSK